MGCDVHMFAEAWNKKIKAWEAIHQPLGPCDECSGTGKTSGYDGRKNKCYMCEGKKTRSPNWYEGRCYDDFSILADVRNGLGFAGIPTGAGFNPINEPRGVPEDASDEYKGHVESWNGDGHSHSYQTLKELLDYDWSQVTQHMGVVSSSVYWDWWKNRGKKSSPSNWCGDISGSSIVKVTNAKMEQLFQDGTLKAPVIPIDEKGREKFFWSDEPHSEGKRYFTTVLWEETYKESAVNLWSQTIPALLEYATKHKLPYAQIRIVYFFDN